MPVKAHYNDKGQKNGPWVLTYEDGGYIQGHYLNDERIGYWELCSAIKLTMIYYVR